MNIAFHDNRLALDHAVALGKEGHDVFYFHEWRYRYGRVEDLIGFDVHDKVHSVTDIWKVLDGCDFFVIADVGYGYEGDYLRKQGKRVFGGNVLGDSLENSRLYAASLMDANGIKHPRYHEAVGVERLMNVAERLGYNFFLKVDVLRGNLETCRIDSKTSLLAKINDAKFGPFQDRIRFIVSEPAEGVEIGVDAWFNGRHFIRPYHFGNEVKGTGCCFGKWVDESVWDGVLSRFENILRGKYYGTISFEGIYDGSDIYVLDVTSRFAKPAGALQYFSNPGRYGEILYKIASGEEVEVRPVKKYTAQISLNFDETEKWWCLGKPRDDVVVSEYGMGIDGDVWVYNRDETGNLVHYLEVGDDFEALLHSADINAFKVARELGFIYSSQGVREIRNTIEKMKALGVDF